MTMPDVLKIFEQKHKVQKSNLVILTDGDSHSCHDRLNYNQMVLGKKMQSLQFMTVILQSLTKK